MTCAVGDQSTPIPEEITSELGGIICNLARRPQSKAPHTLAGWVMNWKRKSARSVKDGLAEMVLAPLSGQTSTG